MALTSISTRKNKGQGKNHPAILIEVDGVSIQLTHASVRNRSAAQVHAQIETIAQARGVELPTITVHANRNGSWAMATGTLSEGFVWPEGARG